MKVELISSEIIKPSSPTPANLRRYVLSFPDQMCPRTHNPFIYYYEFNENQADEISNKLKISLSQALTLYYPLAGRLTSDNSFVDCDDNGALFVEARVDSRLSDVVENDQIPLSAFNKLLPSELDETAEYPLGVQLNFFDCGGVAVGVSISHTLADALSCLVFIRSWMAIARSDNDVAAVARPEFRSAAIFPPQNVGGFNSFSIIPKGDANVTKRFSIDARKIEALRAKHEEIRKNCEEEGNQKTSKRISRIEALSAFIWSRVVASTKDVEFISANNKLYKIRLTVNLRPRFDPPLPEHSFGNYLSSSTTTVTVTSADQDNHSHRLARQMGEEITKVNKDFVTYMRENGDKFVDFAKKEAEKLATGEVAGTFVFTSLCRFPLYEADFGWGKPVWVSSVNRGFANVVSFQDNRNGDGLEVYLCLKAEDMANFEADQEFLSFVSPIGTKNGPFKCGTIFN